MTNAVLNLLVLAVLAVVTGPRLRHLRPSPLLWTALALFALTAVFDTAMIAAGIYQFEPGRILGLRVLEAPIEDFAYPLAAVAALPVLWVALGARPETRSRSRSQAADPRDAP